jgi:hypothetical protein
MLSNAALIFPTKPMFKVSTTLLHAWVPQKPGTAIIMQAELHFFVSPAKSTHAGLNISHLSTQHTASVCLWARWECSVGLLKQAPIFSNLHNILLHINPLPDNRNTRTEQKGKPCFLCVRGDVTTVGSGHVPRVYCRSSQSAKRLAG